MAHLHTLPGQHDFTITLYVVRTDTDTPKALVHMHRKQHMWLPPGGHIETNETPWQAAEHELLEESGFAFADVRILQPKTRIPSLPHVAMHPLPVALNTHDITDDHYHTDLAYAFVADGPPKHAIAEGESAEFRWLSLDELHALPEDSIFANTKIIYDFIINTCLPDWDALPPTEFDL